jgi:hypothetical protein
VPSEKHHQSPEVRAFGELRLQTICSFICLSLFDIARLGDAAPFGLQGCGSWLSLSSARRAAPQKHLPIRQSPEAPASGNPSTSGYLLLGPFAGESRILRQSEIRVHSYDLFEQFPGVYSRLKPSIVQTRNSTEIAVKIVTVKPLKK